MNVIAAMCSVALLVHVGPNPVHPTGNAFLDRMGLQKNEIPFVGLGLSKILKEWGDPERIEEGKYYSTRFADGKYLIVLVYTERKRLVYVDSKSKVIGFSGIKYEILRPKKN